MTISLEKGLPANVDAERYVLGSIQLDGSHFVQAAMTLQADDFSLESHRRIFARMAELQERDVKIDRVTLTNELITRGQLESCGGLNYLIDLDEHLPKTDNLGSYLRIVKEKANLRKVIFASQALMNRCIQADEESTQIIASAQETLLRLDSGANIGRQREPATPDRIIDEFPGGLNALLNPHLHTKGISTGFTKLDDMTGGLHNGEVFVLAARPSMGKTALALNIAYHIATRLGRAVPIFSLEMSRESLLTRMLCAAARVDSQKLRMGYLNLEERHRLQVSASELARAPLLIDDTPAVTLPLIRAKLRRLPVVHTQKLGAVIVDYLQLMGSAGRFQNRNDEVGSISRGFKLLAKEINAPLLVLSQLSRAAETRPGDRRPQLSDLRDSGSIEQDADVVAFIFREEVYKRDREDLRGLAELLLSKQRNGPTGKINLVFLHHLTKFENRAEDLGDDQAEPDRLWNE